MPDWSEAFGDEARLALLDQLPELVVVLDGEARIRWLNRTAQRLLGYGPDDLRGASVFDHIHPDDLGYMVASWDNRLDHPEETGLVVQGRARHADGRMLPFEVIGVSLLEDAAVAGMVITGRDMSRQSALADSPARLRSMIDRTTDIVILLDSEGRFAFANRRLTMALGHDADRVIGSSWTSIVEPADVAAAEEWFRELLAGGDGTVSRVQVRLNGTGGRSLAVELHGTNQVSDLLIGGVIVSARDVEEIARMHHALEERNERLSHAVTHDQLTGLANRRAFVEAVENAIATRRTQGGGRGGDVVVLFCDLDGFKEVNDTHGHSVGDQVLQEIAERLRATVRESDIVARYGGDEFTALLGEDQTPSAVAAVVARLGSSLGAPVRIGDITTRVGVSVGVSRAPADTAHVDTLLSAADAAMYHRKRAKQAGANVAVDG